VAKPTAAQAFDVYRIVNGHYRSSAIFTPCKDDADCTPYMVAGRYHRPGQIKPQKVGTAWEIAGKFYVNLSQVSDWDNGGRNELAFLIGHEMNHWRVYPPEGIAYLVYRMLIEKETGKSIENAYRFHMDFIVNEAMFLEKPFVDYLLKHDLDIIEGQYTLYKRSGALSPPTTNDDQLRSVITRYYELVYWRFKDHQQFERVRGPNYNAIHNFCTDFLGEDGLSLSWKSWDADQWFAWVRWTLLLVHNIMLPGGF